MRDVRAIILKHGIAAARRQAATAAERMSVDAAWAMLEAPLDDLAYACWAVTTLPHRCARDMHDWARDSEDDETWRWQGGVFCGKAVGVPFGAKSRMILLHLLNEAIRTSSLRVKAGASMYEWARLVSGGSLGGTTYSVVAEHSRRIAACSLSIIDPRAGGTAPISGPLIERGMMAPRSGFPQYVVLNAALFEHFKARAVPVRSSALRQLSNNSAAIDLYTRLAARLPALGESILAPWPDIAQRFGAGYKNMRQLKPAVRKVLQLVLAVYPEARVEALAEGLVLHPSAAPIEIGGRH